METTTMKNLLKPIALLASLMIMSGVAQAQNSMTFLPLSYWQGLETTTFAQWGAPQTCQNVIWSSSDKFPHTVMLGAQIVSGSPQIAFYDSDNDAQYQATGIMNVVSSWTTSTTLTKNIRNKGNMTFQLLPSGFFTSNQAGTLYRRGCFW